MERPPATVRIEDLLAHREWVRRMARALVQDDARADDLEQEVWTSALKRPPEGRGLPLRSWLATVLRFRAIDQRRAEARRRVREESVARPEGEPSAAEVVARGEILKRVVTAVMDLEEPYRSTVLLRYFEDLPPAAVAARQRVPLETVRTRLRRALARLRERLDAGQDGGRRAWMAALVPLARGTAPGPPGSAAGGSALAAATGVLAMGVKTKVAVVAGILALTAGSLWRATREPVPAVPGQVPAGESSTAPSRGPARPTSEKQDGGHEATSDASVPGEVALRGRVLDGSGRAIAGAEVGAGGRTALTDAAGAYEIRVPRPSAGLLTVTARFPRFEPAEREIRVPSSGEVPEEEFRLSPDLVVAGRVVDDEGTPVAGAQVLLLPPVPETQWDPVTTDVDGGFSVTRGQTGAFQLRVEAPSPPERWRSPTQSTVVRSGDRDLVVVLRRRPQGRVSLRAEVVDAATGTPCTSTRALVVEATSGLTCRPGLRTTVAPGLVTADGLWPGRWRIWVQVPDHAPAMKEFQVVEDSREVEIRVEVPLRGTLVGRVEFGEVPPTDLLYVHAVNRLSLSGAVPSWLRGGDFDGRSPFGVPGREFEFPLAPGEYVVEAFGRNAGGDGMGTTARTVVHVESGERVNVELQMEPVSRLSFQCGIAAGLVTELWMAKGDGEFEVRDRYVGGGLVTLVQHVSPGTYRWRVRFLADDVVHDAREAGQPFEGTVTVGAGETVILPRAADLKPR